MSHSVNSQFGINGKTLNVLCVSLHGQNIPSWVTTTANQAFEKLVPYIKNSEQVLYIRDIPFLAIDKVYPAGHCYNQYEAMIALANWRPAKAQLQAAIHHELHHLARWQNPGYGTTLGGALLSEGIATFYEQKESGWTPPWAKATVANGALQDALKNWDNQNYDHNDWFYKGPHGKWVGYGIGYLLATKLFADGFNIARSVTVTPGEALPIMQQLTHT